MKSVLLLALLAFINFNAISALKEGDCEGKTYLDDLDLKFISKFHFNHK